MMKRPWLAAVQAFVLSPFGYFRGLEKQRSGSPEAGFEKAIPKDERTWERFAGIPNDRLVLREKAQALAPVLLYGAMRFAEGLVEVLKDKPNLPEADYIFFEALAIDMHFTDRIAFRELGDEHRKWFSNPLVEEVIARLATRFDNSEDAREQEIWFIDLYNKRMSQYAHAEFVSEPNEKGGYNVMNSVGWKLAENLGVADGLITEMAVHAFVATRAIEIWKLLELENLLTGYGPNRMVICSFP
jgi:hypothetical protein